MSAMRGLRADKSIEGLRMYADNVLVLMDHIRDARKEGRTAGGIFIPQQAKKPGAIEAAWATVVLAGPGAFADKYLGAEHGNAFVGGSTFVECQVKPGDRVLVDRADAGDALPVDGLEHRIVRYHNIIAVVEDEEASAAE